MIDKKLTDISVHLMAEESRFGASKVYKPETVTIGTKPKKGVITNVAGQEVTPIFDTENYGVIIIDEPKPVLLMGTNRVGKSSMRQTILNRLKDMTGDEPVVCIQSRLHSDDKLVKPNHMKYFTIAHNDTILATLTEALGSHVISVLRQYPERAAEYLRNWHTECRIYHDRCVVTRRGEVIAEGAF